MNGIHEPEDLRTEYQVCQRATDGESLSFWALAGVFLGLSAVVLGTIIPILNSANITLHFKIAVTLLSVGMMTIYCFLWQWMKRTNERISRYYGRMREIENIRGMQVMNYQEFHMRTSPGRRWFLCIMSVLGFFWILVILLFWII